MTEVQTGVLSDVRERRAGLGLTMRDFETAVSASVPDASSTWVDGVRSSLEHLQGAFTAHVAITEGERGLHPTILADAPRLEVPVRRLQDQHCAIESALMELSSELRTGDGPGVETIRDRAEAILWLLRRHRRQGADLVYEAYQVDLGASE